MQENVTNQATGMRFQGNRSWILDTGYLPDGRQAGCWMLVAGYWLLVSDF